MSLIRKGGRKVFKLGTSSEIYLPYSHQSINTDSATTYIMVWLVLRVMDWELNELNERCLEIMVIVNSSLVSMHKNVKI